MIRRYGLAVCLMLCGFVVHASGTSAVRRQAEASLLVTGTIDIEADGSVSGHALDHTEKLEPGIIELVDRTLPGWRFEPVLEAGKAHKAVARMSLRIVASKTDGQFTVRIRSAHFTDGRKVGKQPVNQAKTWFSEFPVDALRYGIDGTVYLVVRVDAAGNVTDAAAEQVNLRVVAKEREMDRWREVIAKAMVRAARHWQFDPATEEVVATGKQQSLRVPVSWYLSRGTNTNTDSRYGKWEPYIPGPKQTIPWLSAAENASGGSPDALVSGEVYPVGEELRLLTALGEG